MTRASTRRIEYHRQHATKAIDRTVAEQLDYAAAAGEPIVAEELDRAIAIRLDTQMRKVRNKDEAVEVLRGMQHAEGKGAVATLLVRLTAQRTGAALNF